MARAIAARVRVAEDARDNGDGALGERVPAVDAPLEVAPAQVLDGVVFAPVAADDVAAEQGTLVEGGREEGGAVHESGEVDDADGMSRMEADDTSAAARPGVEVASEVLLEGPDSLVEDVLDVVFVGETGDGGDLVEAKGGVEGIQPKVRRAMSIAQRLMSGIELTAVGIWAREPEGNVPRLPVHPTGERRGILRSSLPHWGSMKRTCPRRPWIAPPRVHGKRESRSFAARQGRCCHRRTRILRGVGD